MDINDHQYCLLDKLVPFTPKIFAFQCIFCLEKFDIGWNLEKRLMGHYFDFHFNVGISGQPEFEFYGIKVEKLEYDDDTPKIIDQNEGNEEIVEVTPKSFDDQNEDHTDILSWSNTQSVISNSSDSEQHDNIAIVEEIDTNKKKLCATSSLDLNYYSKDGDGIFECDYCNKTFAWKINMRKHLYWHISDNKKKARKAARESKVEQQRKTRCNNSKTCRFCDKTFTTFLKRCNHEWEHNVIKEGSIYKCPDCPKVNLSIEDSKRHYKKAHCGSLQCHICDTKFLNSFFLTQHMEVHNVAPKRYQCDHCKGRFTYKTYLIQHLNFYASNRYCRPVHNRLADRQIEDFIRRGHKPKLIASEKQLKRIQEKIIQEKKKRPKPRNFFLYCKVCDQRFDRLKMLEAHEWEQHRIFKHESAYKCSKCFEAFPSFDIAKSHYYTSHPPCSGFCYICGKPYSCHFNKHLFKHHSFSRHYQCDHCMKKFSTKLGLIKHLQFFVTKNYCRSIWQQPVKYLKKFKQDCFTYCDFCDQNFNQVKELRHHVWEKHKLVKDENVYNCTKCPNTFSELENAKEHYSTIHSKGSQLCYICGKTFKWKISEHLQECHTSDSFQCDICKQYFSEKGKLELHLSAPHLETEIWYENKSKEKQKKISGTGRTFSCRPCRKIYKSRYSLKKHNKLKHMLDESFIPVNYQEPKDELPEEPKLFHCHPCGTAYSYHFALLKHNRRKHGTCKPIIQQTKESSENDNEINLLHCWNCLRVFNNSWCRKKHNKFVHKTDLDYIPINDTRRTIDMKKGRGGYDCKYCNKTYRWPGGRAHHNLKVHNIKKSNIPINHQEAPPLDVEEGPDENPNIMEFAFDNSTTGTFNNIDDDDLLTINHIKLLQ